MPELWMRSLTSLSQALRARAVSAEEVCSAFLTRAIEVDERVNCFISIDPERALDAARALDRAASRRTFEPGALHGVPFAAKDVFMADGVPPSAGARRSGLRMRSGDSTILERLHGAGAIPLGRLNLDPWGYAATGANPDFGDTLNPWDTDRIAGGSSSGAAVAVAARAVPFAIGADTGGSVRIPAAFCAVTGLKPTFGRIPRRGAIPLSYSQDTVGVLARTAEDVSSVLDRIAGHDPRDPASLDVAAPAWQAPFAQAVDGRPAPLRGVRVGVDRAAVVGTCEPGTAALIEASLGVLERLGATVVAVDLSRLAHYDVAASVLTQAESAAVHGAAFVAAPEDYAPAVRARLASALACAGADHVDAMRYQGHALREMLEGPLADADVVVSPAAAGPPPRRDPVGGAAEAVRTSIALLRLHRPYSFAGVPALALPIGFDTLGLPVGLQLVGRPWTEARVLACAAAYQDVTEWHQRLPTAIAAIPSDKGAP